MICSENVFLCLLAKCCKDSFLASAEKFHIRFNGVLNARVTTKLLEICFGLFSNLV